MRRVETFALLDSLVFENRITIDVDSRYLECERGKFDGDDEALLWRLPVVELNKEVILDVDAIDTSGHAVHLARRASNIDFTSHLLVGCCLDADSSLSEKQEEDLYASFERYLNGETAYMLCRLEVHRIVGGEPAKKLAKAHQLLLSLKHSYIQCVEYNTDCCNHAIDVLKLRFRITAEQGYKENVPSDGESVISLSTPDGEYAIVDAGSRRPSVRLKVLQKLGLVAPGVTIPVAALGSGFPPVHVRFIAPPGTTVEDVDVVAGVDGESLEGRESGIEWKCNPERAIVFDRGVTKYSGCTVMVLLNPQRKFFLWPAFGLTVSLFMVGLTAILSGPPAFWEDSQLSSIIGAFFLIPSVFTVMLVREGEHEFLSSLRGWQRVAGGALATLSIVVACLVVLSSLSSGFGGLLFGVLLALTLFSGLFAFGVGFQISRIGIMRNYRSRGLSRGELRVKQHYVAMWSILVLAAIVSVLWVLSVWAIQLMPSWQAWPEWGNNPSDPISFVNSVPSCGGSSVFTSACVR